MIPLVSMSTHSFNYFTFCRLHYHIFIIKIIIYINIESLSIQVNNIQKQIHIYISYLYEYLWITALALIIIHNIRGQTRGEVDDPVLVGTLLCGLVRSTFGLPRRAGPYIFRRSSLLPILVSYRPF